MEEQRDCYVYVLVHVEENKVFYVGRGKQEGKAFRRYEKHLYQANKGSQLHVHRKIRKLISEKQNIRFEVRVTGATFEESVTIERNLIASIGLDNLTNSEPGEIRINTEERILRGRYKKQSKVVYVQSIADGSVQTFSSMGEASRELGIAMNGIYKTVRGIHSQVGGYRVSLSPILPCN